MSLDIDINLLQYEFKKLREERNDALSRLNDMNDLYSKKINEFEVLEKKYDELLNFIKSKQTFDNNTDDYKI